MGMASLKKDTEPQQQPHQICRGLFWGILYNEFFSRWTPQNNIQGSYKPMRYASQI